MECQQEKIKQNCPCTYPDCSSKGKCCKCVEYHKSKKELPACYFSKEEEKSFDRSIENFVKNSRKA